MNRGKHILLSTGLLLGVMFTGPMMNSMTTITAMAAEQTDIKFSEYWFQENGQWRIKDGAGNIIKGAWVCDDAVASNGKEVWYLIDSNGYMVHSGLVQDNTGNYYSLEMNHYGNYGMLRNVSGTYDGVNLSIESSHNGNFAKILNQDGINALIAKYGVEHFPIDNSNCVYTSTFSLSGSGSGGTQTPTPTPTPSPSQETPSNTDNTGNDTNNNDGTRVPRKSDGGNKITGGGTGLPDGVYGY